MYIAEFGVTLQPQKEVELRKTRLEDMVLYHQVQLHTLLCKKE